jgi:hypothetical protein
LAQVDASLTQNVGPATGGTNGAYFRFTDLGADTTVRLDPSTFTVTMNSSPVTGSFQAGANLFINDMPNQDFDKEVFDIDIASGHVVGHYGVRPSKIDDIELDIENMKSMILQPGKAPFGLPEEVGLLFPGVSGDYGTFSLFTNGVDLNPDVEVGFEIQIPVLPDGELGPVSLPHHIGSLVFHKYDDNGPKTIASIDFGVACLEFKINPEPTGKSTDGVTLDGSKGPQTFNFLDINDDLPDIIVDVIAAYTSPFIDGDISVDGSLGGC